MCVSALYTMCSRIVTYFEEISEKLAREHDLTEPLMVNTEGLTFRGQTVSCI